MTYLTRPLEGCVVNISVSESGESDGLGFPIWQINRTTLQVVSALLGQGVRIVFGHDWRDDGVMEAVYGFARQFRSSAPSERPALSHVAHPILTNLLPWPDSPFLPDKDLQSLADTLAVESAGLPGGLMEFGSRGLADGKESSLYKYLRARGLTHLRHKLTRMSTARVCMGGRRTGSAGRFPGVIEEAILALRASKPLLIAGFLGGAAAQVIQAIERHTMPTDFCAASKVEHLYEAPPITEPYNSEDFSTSREELWDEFAKAGINTVADGAHLTRDELKTLFHSRSVDQVIELVLVSLSRLSSK